MLFLVYRKVFQKMTDIRVRCAMIVQYEYNPITGESLNFNKSIIDYAIQQRADSLKAYAYIRHDKCVYNSEDDIPEGKNVGDVRPPHWHILLQFKNAVNLDALARSFNVPSNLVKVMRGAGAFLDGIQYLTHESPKQWEEKGKHCYPREEVFFASEKVANYWWDVLDNRTEKRMELPSKEIYNSIHKKLIEGKIDLDEAYAINAEVFNENEALFKKARRNAMKHMPLPVVRSNYYISGMGGAGKTVAAKALARSLFPGVPDDKLFFVIGDKKVAFDDYNGEPVIIWDDWRPEELLSNFDRGLVWKIFAVNPERVSLNVKYGDVTLVNAINIVTSVIPFMEFIDKLSAKYKDSHGTIHPEEDKGQGYRRFPMFIEVTPQSLELFVSQSMTGGERSLYEPILKVETVMLDLAKNPTLENSQKVMAPVAQVGTAIQSKLGSMQDENPIDVEAKFSYTSQFDVITGKD